MLVLLETKSSYKSDVGVVKLYSENGVDYQTFKNTVQLQGAQFSFVAKNIQKIDSFRLSDYLVVHGKNEGLPLNEHLKFRVNKSFAILRTDLDKQIETTEESKSLMATLVPPYAIWLKEN